MMAQKKKSAGGMRAPRRSRKKKKRDMGVFIGLGVVGLIVVISAAILLGGRKDPTETKPKTETGETKSEKSRKFKRVSKSEKKRSDRTARRKKRSSRKRGTKRSKRGKSKSSSKKSPLKVEAIMLDDSGEHYALVDERQVRAGDIVGGRRIAEIGSSSLQIEYHGKTYTVRIGQSLY